jgi:hypothetical protein
MKNLMKRFGTIVSALVIIFTLAIAAPAKANDEKKASTVELKFLGNYNDQPVFQLNLNNIEEDEYTIVIRDEYDNVLYTDRLKGVLISQKFRLNTEEIGDAPLRVELKSKKTNISEVYTIGRSQKVVQETVVRKVK